MEPKVKAGGDRSLQRLVLLGRGLRSLSLGLLTVALPLALREVGYGARRLNLVLAAGLGGATLAMQLARPLSRHLGRVGTLALSTAAMAAATGCAASFEALPALLAANFLGALSLQPNISLQAPMEHAVLATSADSGAERAKVFAHYNIVSMLALSTGNLLAGAALRPRAQLLLAALLLLVASSLYLAFLGSKMPVKEALLEKEDKPLSQCPHRWRILGMAALFFVDAFAGGMNHSCVIVHWLAGAFSVSERRLGLLWALLNLVTAPSLHIAAWLGKHIGLVNTMVFTHLPSNVCIMIVPFVPSVGPVVALLLLRAFLGQMDVPARDSFIMSVVAEDERVTCSAVVTSSRALGATLGPPMGALLWGGLSNGPALPWCVAGGLKCAYDLVLLVCFRAVGAG